MGIARTSWGTLEKKNSGGECDLELQTEGFKVKPTGRRERNYLKV